MRRLELNRRRQIVAGRPDIAIAPGGDIRHLVNESAELLEFRILEIVEIGDLEYKTEDRKSVV